jgi:hypothetical protein
MKEENEKIEVITSTCEIFLENYEEVINFFK